MWHARNVNVAKQWYVGVCWGVGCTQVSLFEIQLWNTKSEIWVDVAVDPPCHLAKDRFFWSVVVVLRAMLLLCVLMVD
jgi:hypothetical protein